MYYYLFISSGHVPEFIRGQLLTDLLRFASICFSLGEQLGLGRQVNGEPIKQLVPRWIYYDMLRSDSYEHAEKL